MMDLDSAIQHCREQVQEQAKKGCYSCAEEHQQLAEWLGELKAYRENICEDAVSRQAVLDILDDMVKNYVNENDFDKAQGIAWVKVQRLPSVTPQQRMGRWIAQDIHNCHTDFKCSECGYIHSFMHLYGKPTADYPYCPNCGCKMEVEE